MPLYRGLEMLSRKQNGVFWGRCQVLSSHMTLRSILLLDPNFATLSLRRLWTGAVL